MMKRGRGRDKKKRRRRGSGKKLGRRIAMSAVAGGTMAAYALKKKKDYKTAESLKSTMKENQKLHSQDIHTARNYRDSIGNMNVAARKGNYGDNFTADLRSRTSGYQSAKGTARVRKDLQKTLNQKYRKLRSPNPFV